MTIREQNEAIAVICGYWKDTDNRWHRSSGAYRNVPNYTGNLNDMHEAEKTLQHYGFYYDKLAEVAGLPRGSISVASSAAFVRAEAFLKTIGKWK